MNEELVKTLKELAPSLTPLLTGLATVIFLWYKTKKEIERYLKLLEKGIIV